MPTEDKFWPRNYRDIVTAIVATGSIAVAVWKYSRGLPVWVFPMLGVLVYLVHVVVLSRRAGRAEETNLKEVGARLTAAEQALSGIAIKPVASERAWAPEDALLVELQSGDAHFVQVYDDHLDVLCIVRFLNVASETVVVDHANLTWKVEQAAGKVIAEGTYNEPVTVRPLGQGQHETVTVHQGKMKCTGEFPSCAALMTVSGYVTVKSDAWISNQRRKVSHWIWVSVLNQQSGAQTKLRSHSPSTKATATVQAGAVVMNPPAESPMVDDRKGEGPARR